MSRLDEIKEKMHSAFSDTLVRIKDSEAYQQLAARWDELDDQKRFSIQLGAVALFFIGILTSVFGSIASLNNLKRTIEERESLIGYLQTSAEEIKRYKALSLADMNTAAAMNALPVLAEAVIKLANIETSHVQIGSEQDGTEDKKSKEKLLEVKFNQINLRQLVKFMHHFADQGKAKSVYVKSVTIDTKEDPSGYMDAVVTIAGFIPKP